MAVRVAVGAGEDVDLVSQVRRIEIGESRDLKSLCGQEVWSCEKTSSVR